MSDLLKDKSVVIIGGTTGMGLSAAKACLAEGACMVVVGRDRESSDKAQSELGKSARVLTGDAIDPATAVGAIASAVNSFGTLHALYHVAGGSGRRLGDGPLHEITDDGWRQTFDLNLTRLFNSNRAAVRQFLKQNTGGSVLNMASVLGFSPSPQYFSTHAYAAAKAAAIGFTKAAASYYAPQNVRFNVLAPALVETPMSARAANDAAIQKFIQAKQPLDGGRIGKPSDLDAAAVYFLSDQSRFVTGQVLAIDGGWSVSDAGSRE